MQFSEDTNITRFINETRSSSITTTPPTQEKASQKRKFATETKVRFIITCFWSYTSYVRVSLSDVSDPSIRIVCFRLLFYLQVFHLQHTIHKKEFVIQIEVNNFRFFGSSSKQTIRRVRLLVMMEMIEITTQFYEKLENEMSNFVRCSLLLHSGFHGIQFFWQ